MTISPIAGFGLKTTEAFARDNTNIRFEIKKIDQTPAAYELLVHNTRKEPGRYFDVITLLTDSQPVRRLTVRVFGEILP